ncbi:MAG: winged helix-turn-helix domain-containing protein, partial [Luteimonas sp.]
MTQSQQPGYRFDGFRVDVGSRELIGADGGAVALTGKAFDVLLYLVERAQRVVSKDELLAQVWTGRVVDENNLTQAISALRKALGAGAGDHRYILTEARRGYRFVAAVEQSEGGSTGATSAALGPALDTPPPRHTAWLPLLGWLVLVIAFIAAALLATNALRERTRLAGTGKTATVATTLAVLPFRQLGSGANRSGDELLQLGMAETLIARLSRSTSMRVLSLGSVQGFIGPNVDTVRAARILGAHYVIEGSTQQRGNSVRVNARLLALPDGRTVWAGTYDQAPERVFTLQDSMAEAVIAALALQHITEPRRKRSACDGDDPKAYRAYLRGRYLIQR